MAESHEENQGEEAPDLASPLELWGEALMRKGDYAGAEAWFEEAARYAPNWRRNRELTAQAKARAHG